MIRGQKRIIPKKEFKIPMKLHNRFDIEIVDSKTGKVKQRAQAENVICNNLWARMFGASGGYFTYIHYGTGTGTPASSDTSLFSFLGYKTPSTVDDSVEVDQKNGVMSMCRKVILNPEDNVGSEITEVGIAYETSSSNLCTHAMLKDMNGNTISIVKESTDLINIYATVFIHWAVRTYGTDYIFFSELPFTNYFWIGNWLFGLTHWDATPAMQLLPSNNYNASTTNNPAHYNSTKVLSSTTKTVTITFPRVAASEDNSFDLMFVNVFAGRGHTNQSYLTGPMMSLMSGGSWHTGSSITNEAIGTGDGATTKFNTAFPFPENATIYVDGVEVTSGVTVNKIPHRGASGSEYFGKYFIGISEASTPTSIIPAPQEAPDNAYSRLYPSGFGPYYNPLYEIGIYSVAGNGCAMRVSDDLENWTTIAPGSPAIIPTELQHSKFWFFYYYYTNYGNIENIVPPSSFDGYQVVFDTAPVDGAVITADYTTKAIAKDANHVFDVSVVITLGEYTS